MIIASFITLYVIAKMWGEAFWKPSPPLLKDEEEYIDGFTILRPYSKFMLVFPVVLLTLVSLYIGFGAEHIMLVSKHIASQMIDTTPYVKAVLGSDIQMIK